MTLQVDLWLMSVHTHILALLVTGDNTKSWPTNARERNKISIIKMT